MKNAKLIFEMPTCCVDCKVSYFDIPPESGLICPVLQDNCPDEGRHEDCPIVETDDEECCC